MSLEQRLIASAIITALAVIAGAAFADDRATAAQAEAMVKQAVVHIKDSGAAKAYSDFTNKDSHFIDRDLYIVVYGLDGVVRAHGQNPKLVGQDLMEAQDVDGKYYVKERVQLANSKGTFWQDYKFTDPLTKKVAPKQMYCEKLDDSAVCGGIYKP
jgi:signal transduction histidine kinase